MVSTTWPAALSAVIGPEPILAKALRPATECLLLLQIVSGLVLSFACFAAACLPIEAERLPVAVKRLGSPSRGSEDGEKYLGWRPTERCAAVFARRRAGGMRLPALSGSLTLEFLNLVKFFFHRLTALLNKLLLIRRKHRSF